MNAETASATEILAIPRDAPERLFDGTFEAAKAQFRKLAARWHPDRAGGSNEVFAHVQVLFAEAERRLVHGTWRSNGVLRIIARDRSEFVLRYRKARPFELGWLYYGERVAAWAVDVGHEDLFRRALSTLTRDLRFADDAMRKEHSRYVPEIISTVNAADKYVVVMKKSPDQILLRDLLDHFGGKLDPRHVAWIISSLLNVNCYLNFTGVVHQAISPETWFISPENHSGALLGGWWFAARSGQRVRQVPARTLLYAPPALPVEKIAARATDSALIRATARELLGDGPGSRLVGSKDVPRPMVEWLIGAGRGDAYGEYHDWFNKVLPNSFGPRRFVRMEVNVSDILKES